MTPSDSLTPEQREALQLVVGLVLDRLDTGNKRVLERAFAAGLAFREASPSEATGHRVEIEFDGGGMSAKLICPDGGCTPAAICGLCGHEYGSDEGEPCYDCRDIKGPLGCWIKGWFDNVSAEELLHGKVTVEIDAEWDLDTLVAHIVAPAAAVSPSSEKPS